MRGVEKISVELSSDALLFEMEPGEGEKGCDKRVIKKYIFVWISSFGL